MGLLDNRNARIHLNGFVGRHDQGRNVVRTWTLGYGAGGANVLGAMMDDTKPAGAKLDQGKVRVDLLDADALEGIAKVLTFGANKYAAHNWRGGIAWSRLLGAMMRHLFAIMRGEYTDPESGLPHIDHLGCCWMFLSNHMKNRPDLNDLWRPDAGK